MWVRLVTLAWIGISGCLPSVPLSPDADEVLAGDAMVSVASVWGGGRQFSTATVGPAVVVSGPTVLEDTVFVQDPDRGHGLAVRRQGHVPGWPPPVGATVWLNGVVGGDMRAPVLWISGRRGYRVLEEGPADPIVFDAPPSPIAWTLVRYPDVRVLTDPDPAGRALLSLEREIDGGFGVPLPGFGAEGDLTALVLADDALAPRFASDWTGEVGASEPVDRTVRELLLGQGVLGMTARVVGVQAAPWSDNGRWSVIQDAESGVGIFVDAGAWGVATETQPGDLLSWVVQVSIVNGQLGLRTWNPPEVIGQEEVTEAQTPRHGALWTEEVVGLAPLDRYGLRSTQSGLVLDDRFVDLHDIPDPAWVRGVMDLGREPRRMAVLAFGPLP